jgi:hypothetical protein
MLAHIPRQFNKRLETSPLDEGTVQYLLKCIRDMGGTNLTGAQNALLYDAYPPNRYDKN